MKLILQLIFLILIGRPLKADTLSILRLNARDTTIDNKKCKFYLLHNTPFTGSTIDTFKILDRPKTEWQINRLDFKDGFVTKSYSRHKNFYTCYVYKSRNQDNYIMKQYLMKENIFKGIDTILFLQEINYRNKNKFFSKTYGDKGRIASKQWGYFDAGNDYHYTKNIDYQYFIESKKTCKTITKAKNKQRDIKEHCRRKLFG